MTVPRFPALQTTSGSIKLNPEQQDEITETLWKKIEDKLSKFFVHDMAPEIVDPIFYKAEAFRTPEYRQKAIDEHNKSKISKALKNQITLTLAAFKPFFPFCTSKVTLSFSRISSSRPDTCTKMS